MPRRSLRHHSRAVIFGILLAGVSMLAPLDAQADTITIRADDWCPYTCSPNAAKPGYLIDIAREVFAKAGHSVTYEAMPWARVIQDLADGRITAAAGAGRAEVPNAILTSGSVGRNVNALLLPASSTFAYTGVASLQSLVIGVVNNYSYDNGEIDEYIKAHSGNSSRRIETASGTEAQSSNIRKLLAGRIDAVLENENVLKLALSELQPKPEVRVVPIGAPDDIFIAFSSKNPKSAEYAAQLDRGMAELRASGRLAAILANYGLVDWN